MLMIEVVARVLAEQYTGGNGAAIVAQVGGTPVSDNGSVLVFDSASQGQWSMNNTDWLIWMEDTVLNLFAVFDAALFANQYTPKDDPSPPTLVQKTGTASVPASLLGQTANYDVTLSGGAMPSTSYVPVATLRGSPTIVSGHSILNVTILSTTQVRVQVQSAAASLAGATVHVAAYALV